MKPSCQNWIALTLFSAVMAAMLISCDTSESITEEWNWGESTDFGRVPRWSPDGTRIIFGDDREGSPGIYLWTPGETPHLLTDSLTSHNWDYHWSPDGNRIAFTAPGESGSNAAGVWIVNVDSSSAVKVFDRGRDLSWFHDGQSVVVRIDDPEDVTPGLYRIAVETGSAEFVIEGFSPVCSPTEPFIAYLDSELNGKLYIIDGGLNAVAVSDTGAYEYIWTADGSALFCAVNNYTTGELDWDIVKISRNEAGWQKEDVTQWALHPAPDRTGGRVAFLRISNASWRGLWLHTAGKVDERIADYGQNPDFNPLHDRIAVNSTEGGIRIRQK
jgi:hypothetical protein